MARVQGQAKTAGNSEFTRTIFPTAEYPMALSKIIINLSREWEHQGKLIPAKPQAIFVWVYRDDEGTEHEFTDYVGLPKNFAFNEKSTYWKRLGAIAGISVNNDNVSELEHDLPDWIELDPNLAGDQIGASAFQQIEEYVSQEVAGKDGKKQSFTLPGIYHQNQNLIGQTRRLYILRETYTKQDKTQGEKNKLQSILPMEQSGPPKLGKANPSAPKAPPAPAAPTAPKERQFWTFIDGQVSQTLIPESQVLAMLPNDALFVMLHGESDWKQPGDYGLGAQTPAPAAPAVPAGMP